VDLGQGTEVDGSETEQPNKIGDSAMTSLPADTAEGGERVQATAGGSDPINKAGDGGSVELNKAGVHETPQEALGRIGSAFDHWSGKLTETSLQMCYALIGANWVVFGSVDGILQSNWAKCSLLMVMLTLASNVIGSWCLSESLRRRFEWAEGNKLVWQQEFNDAVGKRVAFPFTSFHERAGFWMRQIKGTFPLLGGLLLIIGAIVK